MIIVDNILLGVLVFLNISTTVELLVAGDDQKPLLMKLLKMKVYIQDRILTFAVLWSASLVQIHRNSEY